LKTGFQGLENQLKILLFFLGYNGYLSSLPIKGDMFAAEEVQETDKRDKRKEKSYTCKSRGEIVKEFELTLEYLLFSIKELYLISCYISLY